MEKTDYITERRNCSLESAGCSMVVAVTQDSLNAMLKEYLDNFQGELVDKAYYMDADENNTVFYESMDYSLVKKETGMDLYDIPGEEEKRTEEQEKAIADAYQKLGFAFGFRFRIGLPEVQDAAQLKDIITFLESDITSIANVRYTMYLKELEIIKIVFLPRKGYIFTHLRQTPEKPWYFTTQVKLDMKGNAFAELPEEIQAKLNPKNAEGNINMDQILSIQQLYMDLNTAKLTDDFRLEGFDKSDEAYQALLTEFLMHYVEECKKKGGIILGYFAKQFAPTEKQEFIKLKDFNFCILPYYSNEKPDPTKQGLYTLNYLFSASGQEIGDLKKYADLVRWNWVDASERGSIHGRMAVDRKGLMDQFADHFKGCIRAVQLTPEAEADVNLVKADFNVWMEPNRSTPVYTFKDNQYSYSYKAEKTAHKSYLNTVDIKISYQVDSTITYENDTVHFVTSIVCTGKINADGGTVKGTLYDSTLTYHVRLGINPFGTLALEPDEEVAETQGDTSIDSDGWMDFVTFGSGNKCLKQIRDYIKGCVDRYKRSAIMEAKGAFSDMNYWVFPGARIFSFKTPEFSAEGNTLAGITYVTPDDEEDREEEHP